MKTTSETANSDSIARWVEDAVATTAVYDLHTHLYPASFGELSLWGIDELLTYHYLIAEVMRVSDASYEQYWAMSRKQQAELIWRELFIERSPIGEACRGVVTALKRLGLDLSSRNLEEYRSFFASRSTSQQIDEVMRLANVHTVVMTNDPLDAYERDLWMRGTPVDPRFKAVLRIDPVLLGWPNVSQTLSSLGYSVSTDLGASTMKELRRFLSEWIDRMKAIYVAVSLPANWQYPDDSPATRVLREAVLPIAREKNLPMALMIGVTRQVNPKLKLAGDSVAKTDIRSLERLLAEHSDNRFIVTMLSRENQHELAVTARKFRNLFLFGCWWFLNNPSLIEEITRMRTELLGTSYVPQHSDSRVLEQLVYKWEHSRAIIAKVVKDKFIDLANAGWNVTRDEVNRTVQGYLSENFASYVR